jgi:hypothetical protein
LESELCAILTDHVNIAHAVEMKSLDKVLCAARNHFASLVDTIDYLHAAHSECFDTE